MLVKPEQIAISDLAASTPPGWKGFDAMTAVATAAPPAAPALFDQKLPPRLIIASFFLLTLPLIAVFAVTSDRWFVSVYLWLFGLTHFVLTLTVYLQSGNLKYFTATTRNVVLYFGIPLAILMGFYVVGVLQLNSRLPVLALVFSVIIRALDFNHLDRQTYGVYQMFKARTGLRPPPLVRHFEQACLICVTLLLLTTFLAGGLCPLPHVRGWSILQFLPKPGDPILPLGALQAAFVTLALVAAGLAAGAVGLLIRAWNAGGRPAGIFDALGYLGVQIASAGFAIVSTPLYFATLAIHYVEYHVLMYPRCFRSQLDDSSGLDRWFAGLRRHRVVFYGVTVLAAGIVLVLRALGNAPSLPLSTRAIVYIFDGLFVFHYFVEMLIWRFSIPFFRKTLSPLYFMPRVKTS
jgi:hypothetical protein